MNGTLLTNAVFYFVLALGVPFLAVYGFHFIRDNFRRKQPRRRKASPGRPIMKHILAAVIFTAGVSSGTAGAGEERTAGLLDSARLAGIEASPLVFDQAVSPDAAVEGRRVSGATILLATTIASAALVTTAWLVGRNSGNACRPDSRFSKSLGTWAGIVSGRWVTLEDGTRAIVPGPTPHPPLRLPTGTTFPDLCVAR